MGDFGYTSVLVEGGSAIISSFVETLNFDKVVTYIGNTIIGGTEATPAVGGRGFESLESSPQLNFHKTTVLDNKHSQSKRIVKEGGALMFTGNR